MWFIGKIKTFQNKLAHCKIDIVRLKTFHRSIWRLLSSPTPANAIVVEVFASLWAEHLYHHAVQVEALHQHPGEGA